MTGEGTRQTSAPKTGVRRPRIAVIVGTRPEIIKTALLPGILRESSVFEPVVLCTGQHRTMADQAFSAFGIRPDFDLELMTPGQSPAEFLGTALRPLSVTLSAERVAGVIVQGDTTSALAGALAAFHLRIPVAHVEAGLRTKLRYSPFPEEMNRSLISRIASLHFCPTENGRRSLTEEGIVRGVFVTGNTVVDAVLEMRARLARGACAAEPAVQEVIQRPGRLILVTGHRRENFDGPLEQLCLALRAVAERFTDALIVYPVHLNPRVQATVQSTLHGHPRVALLPPVDYPSLVALLDRAEFVVTDSGGIQEEAPSLRKFVLVTRESTERPEAIYAGCAQLADTSDSARLASCIGQLFTNPPPFPDGAEQVYGDGTASQKIAAILANEWAQGEAI